MTSAVKAIHDKSGNWRRDISLGFLTIAVALGGFGYWAATAQLDAAVIATGSVGVETDRKAIQHLEGGVVQAILVSDGDRVKEGDVLLRIDSAQSKAAASIARSQMLEALGDQARYTAAVEGQDGMVFPPEFSSHDSLAVRIMADETREFLEERQARANQIDILQKKIGENLHQIEGIRQQLVAAHNQMDSIDAELVKIEPLIARNLIPVSRKLTLQRSRNELEGRAGSLEADTARIGETNETTKLEMEQIDRKATEQAGAKLAEANVRLNEAREKMSVQDDTIRRSELRAPRSGRIVNLKAHTVGAVIKPGETVMEIVPEEDRLVVTARMSPVDVAHVWPGLQAEVKLPSFHSRRLPIALGDVLSVSADALEDAKHEPYYEVKVSVQTAAFPAEIREKLRPGMPADILVATGERTALDYLVQPLADAMHRGMREN